MKLMFVMAGFLLISSYACKKKSSTGDDNCTAVYVTQNGTPCSQWGIKVNGITYPAMNIPSEFLTEGRFVCASYDLFEDMRACACCGGTWVNIKSMKSFVR